MKPTRRHSVVGPWRWPRRATRAPETPKSASAAAAHEDSLRLAQGRGQAGRQEVLTELELRKQLVGSYMAQDEPAVMDMIEAKRRDEWSFFSVMRHPSDQPAPAGKRKRPNRPYRMGQTRRRLQCVEASTWLPPMTPVQEGGAAGSAAPRSKFDLAEEAASTSREVAEGALSANTLQAVYFAEADEEEATQQAARVP